MTIAGASIWDQDAKQYIFDLEGQHEVMIREWKKVFDKHKAAPPMCRKLAKEYAKLEPGTAGAPKETPAASMMHHRAQNAKEETSGGSHGWKPAELKALPFKAWESRAEVLKLAGEIGRFPEAYRTVNMASIGKADDSN